MAFFNRTDIAFAVLSPQRFMPLSVLPHFAEFYPGRCHRITDAGLAFADGAGCFGMIKKDTVAKIATALYCTIVAQRH